MASADGLKGLLRESGIELESASALQLLSYFDLLKKWNARINLTAATEWPKIRPLFQEGIWASQHYPTEAVSHLDIGSGAGFPAVLIRILVPRIRLEMVESRAKKSAFLETVVHALGMDGTRVYSGRLDSLLSHCEGSTVWDCITWKGLKLNARDLLQLRMHAHARTQFWMFHGSELAVEKPEAIGSDLKLLRTEKFPARKGWNLSIYLPR